MILEILSLIPQKTTREGNSEQVNCVSEDVGELERRRTSS